MAADVGALDAQMQFVLLALRDLVVNEQIQEFGVREPAVDCLVVAGLGASRMLDKHCCSSSGVSSGIGCMMGVKRCSHCQC